MMFLGLSLDAWITIVTLVAVMAALLFTRLRSDVVFLGAIATPTTLLFCEMYESQTGQHLGILVSMLPALVCCAAGMVVLIIFRRLSPDINSPE